MRDGDTLVTVKEGPCRVSHGGAAVRLAPARYIERRCFAFVALCCAKLMPFVAFAGCGLASTELSLAE